MTLVSQQDGPGICHSCGTNLRADFGYIRCPNCNVSLGDVPSPIRAPVGTALRESVRKSDFLPPVFVAPSGPTVAQPQPVEASADLRLVPPSELDWIVRVGDQEVRYRDISPLIYWAQNGRVQAHHYIYHPLLKTWLYAKDVAELAPFLKQVEVAKERQVKENGANQMNYASFLLFALSVGSCLIGFWPVALILFLVAIVFSAVYIAKR